MANEEFISAGFDAFVRGPKGDTGRGIEEIPEQIQAMLDATQACMEQTKSAQLEETNRALNESDRVLAEQKREADCQSAVSNANAAANLCLSVEEAVQNAENARENAESAREDAERKREGHESTRELRENSRFSAENIRGVNETNRKSAETERATAEEQRISAEEARDAAEKERESAEEARDSAETDRESAEKERDAAEQARQETFSGYEERLVAATPDDTTVDGRAWTSKKTVDALCMPFEASGNPVQCYPVEGYPLGVRVGWEPVQAGSGDPSPDNIRPITGRDAVSVTRCGKNLFDYNGTITIEKDQYTFSINHYDVDKDKTLLGVANRLPRDVPLVMTADWDYYTTIAANKRIAFAFDKDISKLISFDKGIPNTIPSGKTITSILVYAGQGKTQDSIVSNICFSLGAADYEPYIGSTTDIALPETVYGGTLDLETGVVTSSWRFLTLKGDEQWSTEVNPNNSVSMQIADRYIWTDEYPKDPSFHGLMSDRYPCIYPSPSDQYIRWRSAEELRVLVVDSVHAVDAETWKAYLAEQYEAGTPVQICYKLAKPRTIQLDRHQISALSGVNTIYTDTGTLTVTGREDPRHTIVTLTDRIAALESAAAGV